MSQQSQPSRTKWLTIGAAIGGAIVLALVVHGGPTMPPVNPPSNQLVTYTSPNGSNDDQAEYGPGPVCAGPHVDKSVVQPEGCGSLRPLRP